jgi:hypothetical protein
MVIRHALVGSLICNAQDNALSKKTIQRLSLPLVGSPSEERFWTSQNDGKETITVNAETTLSAICFFRFAPSGKSQWSEEV